MDCEKCQSLLSDLLDGTLIETDSALLDAHLSQCLECLATQRDLRSIITAAREFCAEEVTPPNPRAMWIRISNAIESEMRAQEAQKVKASYARQSFGSRFLNRRWELSLGQLVGVVASVILVAAFGTFFGLRGLRNSGQPETVNTASVNAPNQTEAVADRFATQRMAIEYWQQRVEERRAHWNPQMREAFDRNINVIDQAVNDSMRDLSKNPHDEVTEEMLNDAMRGKIELLKEFSEL